MQSATIAGQRETGDKEEIISGIKENTDKKESKASEHGSGRNERLRRSEPVLSGLGRSKPKEEATNNLVPFSGRPVWTLLSLQR